MPSASPILGRFIRQLPPMGVTDVEAQHRVTVAGRTMTVMLVQRSSLDTNRRDYEVAVLKAALSAIPWFGSAAAEVVAAAIPDQRLDRVASALSELRDQVERLLRQSEEVQGEALLKLCREMVILEQQGVALGQGVSVSQLPDYLVAFSPAGDAISEHLARSCFNAFDAFNWDALLSVDFRNVFYKQLNTVRRTHEAAVVVVTGPAGCGKTFTTLLVVMRLLSEGVDVWYCSDPRKAELTAQSVRRAVEDLPSNSLLIVDAAEHDIDKIGDIVTAVSTLQRHERPTLVIITRALGRESYTQTFGAASAAVRTDTLVKLEAIVRLYFARANAVGDGQVLIEQLPMVLADDGVSRDLAFWNELLPALLHARDKRLTSAVMLQRLHTFYQKRRPQYLQLHDALAPLLPYFVHSVPLHYSFACACLGESAVAKLGMLLDAQMIRLEAREWETTNPAANTTALLVIPMMHATAAAVLNRLLHHYYGIGCTDTITAVAEYATQYWPNLYDIVAPFVASDELVPVFSNTTFRGALKRYLTDRHFGKKYDRLLRRMRTVDPVILDNILDNDVLTSIVDRLNAPNAYTASKVAALNALRLVAPEKAAVVALRISPSAILMSFQNDPSRGAAAHFKKWFEIFDRLHARAPSEQVRAGLCQMAANVVDMASSVFLSRVLREQGNFYAIDWMVRNLRRMGLASAFMAKVSPEVLAEMIKTKEVAVRELVRVLVHADGSMRNSLFLLLHYEDIERVFSRSRSTLRGLVLAMLVPELARSLVRYASNDAFRRQASAAPQSVASSFLRRIAAATHLNAHDKTFIFENVIAARVNAG